MFSHVSQPEPRPSAAPSSRAERRSLRTRRLARVHQVRLFRSSERSMSLRGHVRSNRSNPSPRAFESARLVPGTVTALIVNAPSLNSGKNDRPAAAIPMSAATSIATRAADDGAPVRERPKQPRFVPRLQPPRQARLFAGRNGARVRQKPRAQHRRHGQCHDERSRQRHDVGKA